MQIDELLARVAGSGEPVPWEISRAVPLPREALREVVRTGTPELCRAALEVLVTRGGPRGPAESDLALVRRRSHGELRHPGHHAHGRLGLAVQPDRSRQALPVPGRLRRPGAGRLDAGVR